MTNSPSQARVNKRKKGKRNVISIPKGKWVITVFESTTFDGCFAKDSTGAYIVTVELPKGAVFARKTSKP